MKAPLLLLLVLAAPDGGTASISGGRWTANRVVVTEPDAGTAAITGERSDSANRVVTAPDAATATITGEWWTADRANRVVITCTSKHCSGRLSWLLDEADGGVLRDTENPDPRRRSRRLLGLELLSGLKPLGDGTYEGTLYDPTDGSTYRGRVTPTGARTLSLRGFVGVPLFGRSETWTRAD